MDILRNEYLAGAGIRITRLSDKLQVLETHEISDPAFSDKLTAVLSSDTGGYFVTACDLDSVNSIAEISPADSIRAIHPIYKSPTANECAKVGLARGRAKDLLVFFGSSLTGNRLLRLETP